MLCTLARKRCLIRPRTRNCRRIQIVIAPPLPEFRARQRPHILAIRAFVGLQLHGVLLGIQTPVKSLNVQVIKIRTHG